MHPQNGKNCGSLEPRILEIFDENLKVLITLLFNLRIPKLKLQENELYLINCIELLLLGALATGQAMTLITNNIIARYEFASLANPLRRCLPAISSTLNFRRMFRQQEGRRSSNPCWRWRPHRKAAVRQRWGRLEGAICACPTGAWHACPSQTS